MMWNKLKFKHMPTAQSLKESRLLKPIARYLHHHFLWQFNRRGVAGGLAIGLFFGILFPFLQILFAAIFAILLRVNLPVAAGSTLVTNPLTFPAIYYAAYRLGKLLTGGTLPEEDINAMVATDMQDVREMRQSEMTSWLPELLEWAQSVGLPLALGLLVLASAAALAGYFLTDALWKIRSRHRWRKRRLAKLGKMDRR